MDIRIVVRNPTLKIPNEFLKQGAVELDLTDASQLSLYKSVSELNDYNNLKIDGAAEFSVTATPLNRLLWSHELELNSFGEKVEFYDVVVFIGSFVYESTRLRYREYREASNEIILLLELGSNHWLTAIKDIKIKDIDYGPNFVLNRANVLDNWENHYKNLDDTAPYFYPMAVYGQTVPLHYSIQ